MALLSGCDFHLSYQNLERLLAERTTYTVNQGRYLLTEFSNYGIAPQVLNIFHQLRLADLVPVITHPERNPLLWHQEKVLLRRLAGMGCPIQITAGSLLGRFGQEAQRMAGQLLGERLVHFVASDAHDTQHRPPRLSAAHAFVAQKYGAEMADWLLVANPLAAIESRPLPYFPEPAAPRHRRPWFFRRR